VIFLFFIQDLSPLFFARFCRVQRVEDFVVSATGRFENLLKSRFPFLFTFGLPFFCLSRNRTPPGRPSAGFCLMRPFSEDPPCVFVTVLPFSSFESLGVFPALMLDGRGIFPRVCGWCQRWKLFSVSHILFLFFSPSDC